MLKNELNAVKNDINQKDIEIGKLNEKIKKVEDDTKSEMIFVKKKCEALENEIKNQKDENKMIKSFYEALGKEVEALKAEVRDKEKEPIQEKDDIQEVEEINKPERELLIACEKCDFVGRSESGLKTHVTVKHNKSSIMRAYSKVTR